MREGAVGEAARPLHVAVVGGGISGLSTAWYVEKQAAARGVPVACSVYESAGRWGGRILTDIVDHEEGRFVVEGGPDSFLTTQKPWAVDLALELGLAERLLGTNDAARKVYVLSRGRPVPLPDGVFLLVPTKFKPFLLSPLISPLGKLRMGLDVFIPARKGDGDETLGDFVTRRLGSEALDKIAEPLLSGIYNAEARRQSLLATFPRFRETELACGSLIRGMLAGKAQARRATGSEARAGVPAEGRPSSMFASFAAGTEEIVAGLTRRLEARLRVGVGVRALRPGAEGGYVLEVSGEDKDGPVDELIQADAVVLAIPAYDAAGLLASVCPEAAGTLGAIRYVSTGTMSLAYKRDASAERLGGFGVLLPRSEKRPLNAVTWSSTKFDHRAPEGHSLLRVFFGGSRSPGSMQLGDGELLDVVKKELRSIMGVAEEPLFHRVYRWERANPQYDVEHLSRVEAVERALPSGIWVTGSPYRGVGLPDCVYQAQVTADKVVEQLKGLQRSAL
ncbi:MAG: protoporphyrinogen oxidase [Actinobacteria bacterium RBG_16_64_13]|nr:MAG: protoporphyrinogen oxidase [Actinobacteria bacterium RBG_16_64_13]